MIILSIILEFQSLMDKSIISDVYLRPANFTQVLNFTRESSSTECRAVVIFCPWRSNCSFISNSQNLLIINHYTGWVIFELFAKCLCLKFRYLNCTILSLFLLWMTEKGTYSMKLYPSLVFPENTEVYASTKECTQSLCWMRPQWIIEESCTMVILINIHLC